jgi:hypothetical protein
MIEFEVVKEAIATKDIEGHTGQDIVKADSEDIVFLFINRYGYEK